MFLELQKLLYNLTEIQFFMVSFLFVIALLLLICVVFFVGRLFGKRKSKNLITEARKDAVKRSRAILNGQLNEQFAAYLPGFPGNAMDSHFLGKPIDFICFSGLNEKDEVDEIVFIEVKTGQSSLSAREKSVKKAIEEGRIRYEVYNVRELNTFCGE